MGIEWPKQLRRLAREGFEANAVIVGFRGGEGAGSSQPVARVVAPDGSDRLVANGLSSTTEERRGRGDVLRVLVAQSADLAVVLAEPGPFADEARRLREAAGSWNPTKLAGIAGRVEVHWGWRVEAVVLDVVPHPAGGSQVLVQVEGREVEVGPALAGPDPRRAGDVIDLGLGDDGSIERAPFGPGPGATELRAQMAAEPSLLKKLWRAV
jgi:hypothetical protein